VSGGGDPGIASCEWMKVGCCAPNWRAAVDRKLAPFPPLRCWVTREVTQAPHPALRCGSLPYPSRLLVSSSLSRLVVPFFVRSFTLSKSTFFSPPVVPRRNATPSLASIPPGAGKTPREIVVPFAQDGLFSHYFRSSSRSILGNTPPHSLRLDIPRQSQTSSPHPGIFSLLSTSKHTL
jgi:hypothetical protein